MKCPNDCSGNFKTSRDIWTKDISIVYLVGHGRCLSMRQLAAHSSALPLSDLSYRYNLPSTYSNMTVLVFFNITSTPITIVFQQTRTWDSDKIYGCLCDSSWDVGLASNQTQEPEWFGADCSLRKKRFSS